MDLSYRPAIIEIIEKCRAPPFSVSNNPARAGEAVDEMKIWHMYYLWRSFVPTTNRYKDASLAVQLWATESGVWRHFFDVSVPGYAFFRSDPSHTPAVSPNAVQPHPLAANYQSAVHPPLAVHPPPAPAAHPPPTAAPSLQSGPTAPSVSTPAVISSEDPLGIFTQWRSSGDKLTFEVVDDEEESAGAV